MRLKNTSRYPDDEVRRLVEFGMKGVRTAGLAVHVKNTACGIAGMAYEGVPYMSPARKLRTVERLVTLRVGVPESFPGDNVREFPDGRWMPGAAPLDFGQRYQARWNPKAGRVEHRRAVRRPYGGKRAPVLEYRNWREGLVAIAAHEARHIHQYQHGKPRSEVDCERFAAKALERYRRSEVTK
jgi:hypothetical protein